MEGRGTGAGDDSREGRTEPSGVIVFVVVRS